MLEVVLSFSVLVGLSLSGFEEYVGSPFGPIVISGNGISKPAGGPPAGNMPGRLNPPPNFHPRRPGLCFLGQNQQFNGRMGKP